MYAALIEISHQMGTILCVWMSVLVVCFFNRRLGWPLAGLVVPGLFAPLILFSPLASGVLIFESALTYLLVRLLGNQLLKTRLYCPFFGRDRFFAMLIASIFVRIGVEVLLWEQLVVNFAGAGTLTNHVIFGISPILVPLLANQLWKTGMIRGLFNFSLGASILLAFAVWVVQPLFGLGFEEWMTQIESNQIHTQGKLYIFLLTASFVASRFKMNYGWDTGGILFPALLALTWYDPIRLVLTIIEFFVCLFVANELLRKPIFSSWAEEGAKRISFFFTVAIFNHLWIEILLWQIQPGLFQGESFSIGFLIAPLLALRCKSEFDSARILGAITRVTAIGTGVAIMSSLILNAVSYEWTKDWSYIPTARASRTECVVKPRIANSSFSTPSSLLRQYKPFFFAERESGQYVPFSTTSIDSLRKDVLSPIFDLLTPIWNGTSHTSAVGLRESSSFKSIQLAAKRLGFELIFIGNATQDASLALVESQRLCFRGFTLFSLRPSLPTSIHVPFPGLDPWSFESGITLFSKLNARVFVAPTAHPMANLDGSAHIESNLNRNNMYVVMGEELLNKFRNSDHAFVEIRSVTEEERQKSNHVSIYAESNNAPNIDRWIRTSQNNLNELYEVAVADVASRRRGSSILKSLASRSGSSPIFLTMTVEGSLESTSIVEDYFWEKKWADLGKDIEIESFNETTDAPSDLKMHSFEKVLGSMNPIELVHFLNDNPSLMIRLVENKISGHLYFEVSSKNDEPTKYFLLSRRNNI